MLVIVAFPGNLHLFLDHWLPTECPAKTLIRLCRCASRSESSMGAYAISGSKIVWLQLINPFSESTVNFTINGHI